MGGAKKRIWFPFTEDGSLLTYSPHDSPADNWGYNAEGRYVHLPFDEDATEIVREYPGKRYKGEVDGKRVYEDYIQQTLTWRTAFEARMTLTYDHYERGRSAAHTYWVRDDGAIFPVFLTCLDDLFEHCTIVNGRTTADWTFIKRGGNYSMCLVGYEARQAAAKRERKAEWDAKMERYRAASVTRETA